MRWIAWSGEARSRNVVVKVVVVGQTVKNTPFPACGYKRRIVYHMVAMIDAVATQQVERIPDMGGRAILAGMRSHAQARIPGAAIDFGIQSRWIADLVVIEPQSDHFLAPVREHKVEELQTNVGP
jgi:hypothetical protein